jgi:hypothetical protein
MKTIKKIILNAVLSLIIVMVAASCLNMGKNEYYVRFSGPVEISHVVIPDTVENNSYFHIVANAQAHNGCWSNLTFLLNKTSSFEYTLQAFGLYESTGSCTDIMVYGDTSIVFQPTAAGLYRFYITKSETETEIDTLIVK